MNKPLLDKLKTLTGAAYLSDLCSPLFKDENIYYALESIDPHEYSLWEWEDAVEYILKSGHIHFDSPEKAHQFLCSKLRTAPDN